MGKSPAVEGINKKVLPNKKIEIMKKLAPSHTLLFILCEENGMTLTYDWY